MDLLCCRLCVRMMCSELGKDATSEVRKITSWLVICGGGVRSILLLPLMAQAHVCLMHVVMTVSEYVSNVWCVASVAKDSFF